VGKESSSYVKKTLDPELKSRLEMVMKELFSSNDFHQVNMRCIAEKTGMGLNTIYMHYESKERMLFAFINEWMHQLDQKVAEHLQGLEDTKEKIRKSIWSILDFYEKNPDIATIILVTMPFKTWMTDETFKQKDLFMRFIDLFREGQRKGDLNPKIPAEVMLNIFSGTLHRLLYMQMYLKKMDSLTSYTNLYCDIFWRALEDPSRTKQP